MESEAIQEAINLAKSNNQKAFGYLFETFWDYLYSYLLKKTRNEDQAEDIAVRTFAKAFDKIDTFNPSFTFETWLTTISRNIQIDQHRKKKSKNKNTIVYTFGIWCSPCRLHLKNAIDLRKKYDVNLLVLLIETETDVLIQKTIDYLVNIDPEIRILLIKDKYGKKRNRKYTKFLDEVTPEKFKNINGMSKYLVFNKTGEIEMITTWKDNRKNNWKDDSNMIKNKIFFTH